MSRIGYRRCGSRRSRACGVNLRPIVARNRRRSAGSTDYPGGPRPGRVGTPACRPRRAPRPPKLPPARSTAQVLRDQPQMAGASLGAAAVGTDLGTVDPELLGQPRHRDRRGGHHTIGHELQPRQQAHRDRDTEPISRTTTTLGIDERQVRRREREEPAQLLTSDLRDADAPAPHPRK